MLSQGKNNIKKLLILSKTPSFSEKTITCLKSTANMTKTQTFKSEYIPTSSENHNLKTENLNQPQRIKRNSKQFINRIHNFIQKIRKSSSFSLETTCSSQMSFSDESITLNSYNTVTNEKENQNLLIINNSSKSDHGSADFFGNNNEKDKVCSNNILADSKNMDNSKKDEAIMDKFLSSFIYNSNSVPVPKPRKHHCNLQSVISNNLFNKSNNDGSLITSKNKTFNYTNESCKKKKDIENKLTTTNTTQSIDTFQNNLNSEGLDEGEKTIDNLQSYNQLSSVSVPPSSRLNSSVKTNDSAMSEWNNRNAVDALSGVRQIHIIEGGKIVTTYVKPWPYSKYIDHKNQYKEMSPYCHKYGIKSEERRVEKLKFKRPKEVNPGYLVPRHLNTETKNRLLARHEFNGKMLHKMNTAHFPYPDQGRRDKDNYIRSLAFTNAKSRLRFSDSIKKQTKTELKQKNVKSQNQKYPPLQSENHRLSKLSTAQNQRLAELQSENHRLTQLQSTNQKVISPQSQESQNHKLSSSQSQMSSQSLQSSAQSPPESSQPEHRVSSQIPSQRTSKSQPQILPQPQKSILVLATRPKSAVLTPPIAAESDNPTQGSSTPESERSSKTESQMSSDLPSQMSSDIPSQKLSKTEPQKSPIIIKGYQVIKSEAQPQKLSKAEPHRLSKTEPQRLSKAEPQRLSKAEPQRLSKEPQRLSKTEPHRLSKTEPHRLSKTEPHRSSKSSPQPQRSSKSSPQPQRSSKSSPQFQPQRLSKSSPQHHNHHKSSKSSHQSQKLSKEELQRLSYIKGHQFLHTSKTQEPQKSLKTNHQSSKAEKQKKSRQKAESKSGLLLQESSESELKPERTSADSCVIQHQNRCFEKKSVKFSESPEICQDVISDDNTSTASQMSPQAHTIACCKTHTHSSPFSS